MKINRHKTKLLIFIFTMSVLNLKAQNSPTLKFSHLTVDDGLSSNRVYGVLQDKMGFLWITTNNGLNRYDGYEFRKYYYNAQDAYSINGNEVFSIYEDKKGNIWLGTLGAGLCRYDRQKDRFIRYPELSKYTIYSILEDDKDDLWAVGQSFLGKLNLKTGKFENIIANYKLSLINLDKIRKGTRSYEIWISSSTEGLFLLNTQTLEIKNFRYQENQANSPALNTILSIYVDKKGLVWLGYTPKGVDCFDPEKQTFTHYSSNKNLPNTLPEYPITSFLEVGKTLWIGTQNGGLSIFNSNNQTFTNYTNIPNNPYSLSSNSIALEGGFYQDKEGRIYVPTHLGGLNILDKNAEKFDKLNIDLLNPTVNAVLKDKQQNTWIGTEKGLVKVNKEGKANYYFDYPILTIAEDKQGRIWTGSWQNALDMFDPLTNQFTKFLNDNTSNKVASNSIFHCKLSKDGKQLLMGNYLGFSTMSLDRLGIFSNHFNICTENSFIRFLEETDEKSIWLSIRANGLAYYEPTLNKFTCFKHQANNPNSLSSNNTITFFQDSKSRKWVGTQEGLNLMSSNGVFKRFTTQDGLPNDAINAIMEDNSGNLWLSTLKGISKFNPEKKAFRNYDISDGLQSNEFVRNSFFKDENGKMYLGSAKGLNVFHPDSIKNNTQIPLVHITGLNIFNKPVKIGNKDGILSQDIAQTKEITLTYKQSVFSLEFVGISLTHPEKNQYAYILEGFEKEWNYVGSKREATYTNLDAGTYTFRVKASNNDGLWNEEGTSIRINILPPWWKTWWFRTIGTILFLSSGIIFYLIRINAVKKQNQRLENQVKERTKQLEFANYEVKVKNESLQTSEEELRQNMEELSTNQELLKEQKQIIETAFENLNKQSTKVNDSIRYAQRIQNAILPHENILAAAFIEHFVIFKPKDVVSGDFYWYLETTMANDQLSMTNEIQKGKNKKFLAVVDCTGHGVPGAFMSMIGNTLLYEIINAKRIFEPNLILEELHLGILNSLNKGDVKMQDGMDIAICCIETQEDGKVKVQFGGAKRPLFYFSNNQLFEIQSDKKSIGQSGNSQVPYTLHEIILHKGDTLYMTTDGWIDAINPERRRFGSQQFREMLMEGTNLPLKAQKEVFSYILEEYEQGTEQRDDILLVGVRV